MSENSTSPKTVQAAITTASPAPTPLKSDASRPSAAVVSAFLEHVLETGDPHAFPGVVDTKPPADTEFIWLTSVIVVPVHKRENGEMVPCPWCSKGKPKFKRGRLCWFPVEGVMRFVGWTCAKTHLDEDRMREADTRWREENRKNTRDAFLRENCCRVGDLRGIALKIEPAAAACDRFYQDFAKDSSGVHGDLARYIRGGELIVFETPEGNVLEHHKNSFSRRLGVLNGRVVFKNNPHLRKKLRNAVAQLGSVAQDAKRAMEGELNHMDDKRRDALEIIIKDAHKDVAKVATLIRAFQAFLEADNIDLLDAWCRHPGSPVESCGIEVGLSDLGLHFVYRVRGNKCTARIATSKEMFAPISNIQPLQTGVG